MSFLNLSSKLHKIPFMISNMKSLATDLLSHDEALNVSVHTCSFPKDCR